MQKVDRLGWAAGVCFKAYGWKIGVRVNKPEALEQVLPCLPPAWEPSEPPFVDLLYSVRVGGAEGVRNKRLFNLVYFDASLAARSLEVADVHDALESKFDLVETRMQQLNASVNVYRALGGGWK